MKTLKAWITFIILVSIGAGVFIWSGTYNVAANVPHWEITFEILEQLRDRSVAKHSEGINAPPLTDPKLEQAGFHVFNETCRLCHGAPGLTRSDFAMGLYPSPPDLASAETQEELKAAEVFWIVKNGLKLTGMPAFGITREDKELWGIVALVRHLHEMKPEDYKAVAEAEAGRAK
jgi:mono/diheme cytochrome c family protein